jgi:hypothetical protein
VVRHDPGVSPDLHLDPVALRAAARAVEALLPPLDVRGLDPDDLRALAGLPGGAALVAEHDRLLAATARARRELVALADGLGAAAAGVDAAEQSARRAMTAVVR